MAATEAVLGTFELLENIVIRVPALAYNIHNLRQVSKTWREVIKSSSKIHQLRCLKPISDEEYHDSITYVHSPGHYIRFHPELCSNETNQFLRSRGITLLTPPKASTEYLNQFANDYATYPRCAALGMGLADWTDCDLWRCAVFVKDGVKVREVLAVHRALVITHSHYGVDELLRWDALKVNAVTLGLRQLSSRIGSACEGAEEAAELRR